MRPTKKREPSKTDSHAAEDEALRPQPDERLGTYIRRVRMTRRMKAVDVTKATRTLPDDQQWSSGYLSQVETGVADNPSHSHLVGLAYALQIPIDWLTTFRNPAPAASTQERMSSHLLNQITFRASQLPVDQQKIVLSIIEAIARQQKKE
jgi:transcriptional regulator with XRE-family HTH domain